MHSEPDGPYEPWQPQRGQWVKVRVSGECSAVVEYDQGWGEGGYAQRGHDQAEDGQVGVVIDVITPGEFDDAHRFLVQYDQEVLVGENKYPQTRQFFAAIELEPHATPGPDFSRDFE